MTCDKNVQRNPVRGLMKNGIYTLDKGRSEGIACFPLLNQAVEILKAKLMDN